MKNSLKLKQLIVPIKNVVIQYKWPMIGQYEFLLPMVKYKLANHWSFVVYDVILYRHYKLFPKNTLKHLYTNLQVLSTIILPGLEWRERGVFCAATAETAAAACCPSRSWINWTSGWTWAPLYCQVHALSC